METRSDAAKADPAPGDERAPSPAPLQVVEDDGSGAVASPAGPRIVVRTAAGWSSRQARQTRTDASGFWLVRDSCGLACASLAWAVMLYAELVVLCVILAPAPSHAFRFFGAVVFHCLMGLALVAHIKSAFSDPGAVPLNSATNESILRLGPMPDGRDRLVYKCGRCSCLKSDRIHHCSVCGRCIRRMDHHCPWINNCVGLLNQKFFVLFTFYISLTSGFSIYLCLHYLAMCLATEWEACISGPSPPVSTMLLLVLMVLCLLFGIFTMVMAGSQVSAILSNTTGIEKIKGEHRATRGLSRRARLEAVFGYPFSWRWFSPFHSPRLGTEDDQTIGLLSA